MAVLYNETKAAELTEIQEGVGLQLPMWQSIRELNERVARIFSPVAYSSLDIGLTPRGPVVVEVNSGGSFDLIQMASDRGFLQPEVRAFFESHGCFRPFRRQPP
jgi:hypothetical protein